MGRKEKMQFNIVYSIIVPLYNEQEVINESYKRLKKVMDITKQNYEIIFVNDGSKDNTKFIAEEICSKDKKVKLINFSRNFGHQVAITAGMNEAKGAAIVVIDADLQDPPEIILEMIKKWRDGYDVIYGKRIKREGETLFKKLTANVYYRMLRKLSDTDIPVDTGDFRLIDRKVCDALKKMPEKNRFIRGMVSWLGFRQTYVEFVRKERFGGSTKYRLNKMLKLAFDGITSFSNKPLRISGWFGGILFFIGIILNVFLLIKDAIDKSAVLSLSLVLSVNFILFGLVFIVLGIMGGYLGRIFDEVKDRPMYIVESRVNCSEVINIDERKILHEVDSKQN